MNLILKQIFIGCLTNIVAYVPVFLLIQLFERTSSVWSKSTRLEKLIKNTGSSINKKKIRTEESKSLRWTFPWWFKIFLYLGSFVSMASSIVLVTLKGILKKRQILYKTFNLGHNALKNCLKNFKKI